MPFRYSVTTKPRIWHVCVVANTYNYYGVKDNFVWHLRSCASYNNRPLHHPRLFRESEKIWYEGPRGGIRLIKKDSIYQYKYITSDETSIKEFFWIKIQAKNLNIL